MNTMKNFRHIITGLTTLAVVSFGGLAWAEESGKPDENCKGNHSFHHQKGDRRFGHLADVLELTDQQRQTLATHKEEHRANYREQRQQVRQTQRALHDAIANNAAEEEVAALADKLGDLTAQQVVVRAKEKQFLLSILTPEQKMKMEQMKSDRKNRWSQKRENSDV